MRRINFCGCCLHNMCDMCAAMHPGFTPQIPCHLTARFMLFEREKQVEKNMVAQFHPAPAVYEGSPPEIHIDEVV
jgi:hypothetical protein